jgi:hypothetical protein
MKKMSFIVLALLLTAAVVLSSCTLPARIDAPVPTAGEVDTLPHARPTETEAAASTPTESSALPELPSPTPAGQEPAEETPTSAPPVITATTAPTEPPTQVPTPEPTATTPPPSPAVSATRIQFTTGGTSATVRGELDAGETEHYVLQASAGQTMHINAWSPNGDVYVTVEGADGKALVTAADRVAQWSGNLPDTQDYNLNVTASGGMTSYSVTIEIPSLTGIAQPTATAAPTSPPSPTSFDPYKSLGAPNWIDEMNSGSRTNWAARDGSLPDTDNLRITIENNRVYVTGKNIGFKTWYFSWVSLKNAFIELAVETAACSGKDAYGLILRGPEHMAGYSHGYVVSFSCDGAYQLSRIDGADPFTAETLVDWTHSEYIRSGSDKTNVIGVRSEGQKITVYANGEKIAEISDSKYSEGRIGLYVAASSTANFTYRPVKLAYWKLD